MDWTSVMYILYGLGSLCFLGGTVTGLLIHMGVL